MGIQQFCSNLRRRQAVAAHPTLNGIDYLEVLDQESPEATLRQRTLLVRLLKPVPAGLTRHNVQISGGVRVTPVTVEWVGTAAAAADLFTQGLITAAERDFFLAQPAADHLLLVRTNAAGDFSTYYLRLVASLTDEQPPAGFDLILVEVAFSFKVECPSDFDCAPDDTCPPEPPSAPAINYLAKDYASFRQLLLDRLAIIMPDWQERNAADLQIALVELLAYAGDHLSYFQDAVATEAYLGTARRRVSVRRHARLLNYAMHDGCNARTWVQLEVGTGADGALLPARDPITNLPTRFLSRIPQPLAIPETELGEVLSQHPAEIFELTHDLSLRAAHNRISLYTWGDEACCLPAGATRATLRDSADPAAALQLQVGDVLILEEVLSPVTGLAADADPTHRWAVRLTEVTPGQDTLFEQPVVAIAWGLDDALPFPLCLSTVLDGQLVEDVSLARGNVALADHGRTLSGEELPLPAGHRRYRPVLQQTGITFQTPLDLTRPAALTLVQDPRAALPAVSLDGDGNLWNPQRDLLASDRFATEFVVETESDGYAQLRFGDGQLFGAAPPTTTPLQVTYRIGNGRRGNLGADALGHIVAGVSGVTRVRNPLPAAGGVDPETLQEVRQYAPQAFRRQERAVTEADYAAIAERHSEVQKAAATRRWTGSWHTMFVTVDRRGGLPVDVAFEEELRLFMEPYRLAGHDLEIDGPRFVALDIAMTVCVAEGYFRSQVLQALLTLFSSGLLPDGRPGTFHPDNFTFGQPVYLSPIIAAAMSVPGVLWVDMDDSPGQPNRFQRWGEASRGERAAGVMEMDRLEIARLDNDPSQPENGRLEFFMQGGL